MDFITILGLVAATLSTLAFIPQVIQTWQTKSAKDLSFAMFFLMFTATALWLVYGLMLSALPIIVANGTILVLLGVILYFKLIYK
ncbi:MAG: SemiSWEET transporter [Microscillaceae bacterium]|jgi:MtN3 and saliva related transmembrane protein|nr:SemiSWEET transporter [Microscillaceae bacterium]